MKEAHTAAREASGLHAMSLWRNADASNAVFFLIQVEDRARAEAFMHTPHAQAKGEEAGVLDGEYWFVEDAVARNSA